MEAEAPKTDPPKRKRRWYQFSLRTLLIFTFLCATAAAWLGRKIERKRQEQTAVDAIVKEGGLVVYDYGDTQHPDGPAWLRSLLGENFFNQAQAVFLSEDATDDSLRCLKDMTDLQDLSLILTKITDPGLENLRELANLRSLRFDDTRVSDVGLMKLEGLTQLESLNLSDTRTSNSGLIALRQLTQLQRLYLDRTQVSDAGLENLKGLKQLQHLDLRGTRVTDAGVADLKKALPNCRIDH